MKFGISNLYFINLLFKNYIFFINIYKKYFNILDMKILLSYPRSGNHLMRFYRNFNRKPYIRMYR